VGSKAAAAIAGAALVATAGAARAQVFDIDPGPWRVGVALDLDAGGRYVAAPPASRGLTFFYRAGLGALWMNESGLLSATATASRTPTAPRCWAFGLQAETVRIGSGLGFSLGGTMSTSRVVGFHAGPSLSLFHLEGQVHLEDAPVWAAALYVRLPVGFIARVLWEARRRA
jgi:hypothetical protein